MNDNASPDLFVDESPAAVRTSRMLTAMAIVILACNCLLTSPGSFSEAHQQDTSLLKPVVTALGLGGAFPTPRGIEIRDMIYFCGAALIALVAGVRLMISSRRPRIALDDLLDVRRRASSPMFWWFVLLLASAISTYYSNAPEVCRGQSIIRFMHAAWWWPLAALLVPRHVPRLASALLIILTLLGAVGIWYFVKRNLPDTRLQYPIGNELWLGACLLPGIFVALGLAMARWKSDGGAADASAEKEAAARVRLPVVVIAICGVVVIAALALTRSRSAAVGIAAGVCAIAFLCAQKRNRLWAVLVCLILALAGAMFVQSLRVHGVMGQRAHSIRARLDHEWPYALSLFEQKPVAGHGDGAYSMLAGQFARQEQLDDPAILSFDEWSWVGRAHNEYLELLADLGLIGMVSFIMAIIVTLYCATKFCDRRRDDPKGAAERWLVIGLAAAFFALAAEEFSNVAFREPGMPPIWLSVWAMLWAMVRSTRGDVDIEKDEHRRLGIPAVRLTGTAIGMGAVALLIFAVQNWRAERAVFEAQQALKDNQFAAAIEKTDFAAMHTLHPFRNLIARVYGITARSAEFAAALHASDDPPGDAVMEIGRQGIMRIDEMQKIAPRFLRLSRLEADLSLNLSRAHERLGEMVYARDMGRRFAEAMTRYRADEPFNEALVVDLWRARPDASVNERLEWLRCLLRWGEFDATFVQLLNDIAMRPDFAQSLNDLFNVAMRDRERPPSQWQDRLTPETFRVAGLLQAVFSGNPAQGAEFAMQAAVLYEAAGPRLFAAHSAALHEAVRYKFSADPINEAQENLATLADAYALLDKRVPPTQPLPEALGETRLRVLLGAAREHDAKAQLDKLQPDAKEPIERRLAVAYRMLAEQFIERAEHGETALAWARRSIALGPDLPDAYAVAAWILLRRGDDAEALQAVRDFLARAPDKEMAYRYLGLMETRLPGGGIWTTLRETIADYPPPALQPNASQPTTTEPGAIQPGEDDVSDIEPTTHRFSVPEEGAGEAAIALS